eukprot:TRINITY_DN774_c0_g1_i1.p1 TRINITY_DN774_c0_g1~~TRINITY_DN774_c0_g1_i1.p1  ORF type:complete len:441 (-),score=127.50 TRINITY_DN774_c0_g1_i1:457-1779(-)
MLASPELRPTKLFIGGISQNTTTKDLRAHFSQYGRVLDCVAMRKEDGRSRSFGYVTLDSPEAADKCIAEPQSIDGRVVDVKRAVPERAARERTAGATTPSSEGKGGNAAGRRSKSRPRSVTRSSTADTVGAGPDYCGLLPLSLNADAPEFTPMADDATPSFGKCDSTPAETGGAALETAAAVLKIGAPPGLSLPVSGLPSMRPPPPGFAPPPPPGFAPIVPAVRESDSSDTEEPKSVNDDVNEDVSTAPPSQSTTPTTVTVDCADEDEDEDEEQDDLQAMLSEGNLPSAGSVLHFSGQCRPCNFFGKGRCSNDLDCEFCHMSHQKRKPTRQEKRERKAAWLSRQAIETSASRLEIEVLGDVEKAAAPAARLLQCAAPVQSSVSCMINFDDYSDFSDEDEDDIRSSPAKSRQGASEVVDGLQWTRESLLRIKVAMAGGAAE